MIINHIEKERQVLDFVTRLTGITAAEIKAPLRTQHVLRARTIYSYIMRVLGFSSVEIGIYIMRDHTTVLNLVKQFEWRGYKPEIWPAILEEFPELSQK